QRHLDALLQAARKAGARATVLMVEGAAADRIVRLRNGSESTSSSSAPTVALVWPGPRGANARPPLRAKWLGRDHPPAASSCFSRHDALSTSGCDDAGSRKSQPARMRNEPHAEKGRDDRKAHISQPSTAPSAERPRKASHIGLMLTSVKLTSTAASVKAASWCSRVWACRKMRIAAHP